MKRTGLADSNISIAGRQGPPLDDCIRITLGPREQMAAVAGGMREAAR